MTGAPIVAAAALTVLGLLAFLHWRQLFLGALVAMTFQGILSLALPSQRWIVLMADVVTALTVLKFGYWALRNRRRPPVGLAVLGPWAVLCIWGGIQAMNPAIPNPLMALIGLRTWLLYPPLLWVMFEYVREWRDARRWTMALVGLGSISSLVAAYEYLRGAQWYASLGPGFSAATWQVGGFSGQSVFRANGTFAATGHFGAMLIPCILLAAAWLVASRTGLERLVACFAVLALAMGFFANSQRVTMIIGAIGVLAIIVVALKRFPVATLVMMPVMGAVAGVAAWQVAGAGFLDRLRTITTSPSQVIVSQHLVGPVQMALGLAMRSTLLGNGTGTATAGARYLGPIWDHSEQFAAGLWYELGVIGFMVFFVGLAALLWQLLRAWSTTRDPRSKVFVTAGLAYILGVVATMGTYSVIQYPSGMLLFWSMIGLTLRLPFLEATNGVHQAAGPDSVDSRSGQHVRVHGARNGRDAP